MLIDGIPERLRWIYILEFDLWGRFAFFTRSVRRLAQLMQNFSGKIIGICQVTEIPKSNATVKGNPRFSLTQINVRRPGRC
jgi:hypothetical protein